MISDETSWMIDVLPQPQPENLRVVSEEELREYLRSTQHWVEPEEYTA